MASIATRRKNTQRRFFGRSFGRRRNLMMADANGKWYASVRTRKALYDADHQIGISKRFSSLDELFKALDEDDNA